MRAEEREMVECYYRLRCQDTDRYLCVSEEGNLVPCADKRRADQFAEELIEFTLPVAEVQFDTEFRLLRVPGEELDFRRMHGVINQ